MGWPAGIMHQHLQYFIRETVRVSLYGSYTVGTYCTEGILGIARCVGTLVNMN
jgi:hypothetical protein